MMIDDVGVAKSDGARTLEPQRDALLATGVSIAPEPVTTPAPGTFALR